MQAGLAVVSSVEVAAQDDRGARRGGRERGLGVADDAVAGDGLPEQAGVASASVVKLAACAGVTWGAYMRATRSAWDSCPYQLPSRSRM